MADVAGKCISANAQRNNRAVIRPNGMKGETQSYARGINTQMNSATLEAKYDTRFDDITYYTDSTP